MGEPVNVVRMTISVPRDLKAEMDAAPSTVNWSAAAAEAFRVKLLELASEKETKTMDDVIARMKAAEEIDGNEQRQEGADVGGAWARDDARPRQLRRLEALAEDQYGIDGSLEIYGNSRSQGIPTCLFRVLTGTDHSDDADVDAFWERAVGDRGREKMDDIDFAAGFCEGALEVWGKLKRKL